MLFGTYYAQNYASIIRPGLPCTKSGSDVVRSLAVIIDKRCCEVPYKKYNAQMVFSRDALTTLQVRKYLVYV